MDELLKIIILAIVQGITEFLPISSSGHLCLLKYFFGLNQDGALIEIVLHAGTLISIVFFYRKQIFEILKIRFTDDSESSSYIFFVILAIIPIVIIGFLFGDSVEYVFGNFNLVCLFLIITGIFLIFSNFSKVKESNLNFKKSFLIGIAQMFAILPGISRSGMTIGMANLLGIDIRKSAEFSFIIAIPVLFGVIIKYFSNLNLENISTSIENLLIGLIVSFITGLLALKWLISLLNKRKLWYFGVYCICIGVFSFLFF